MPNSSVQELLAIGKSQLKQAGISSFALDAELLLTHTLNVDRSWLLSHDRDTLSQDQTAQYEHYIHRRSLHEPVAYIVGYKEFFGKHFIVNPSTLIPRPDTEILVETVLDDLALLQQEYKTIHLVDIGTGTGCILLSLLRMTQGILGYGIDISADAIALAQQNQQAVAPNTTICWKIGSLLTPLWEEIQTWHGVLLITANLPYIREEERPSLAKDISFEPDQALFAAEEGSALIRTLCAQLNNITHMDIVMHIEAAPYNLPAILTSLAPTWETRTYQNLAGQTLFGVARKKKLK